MNYNDGAFWKIQTKMKERVVYYMDAEDVQAVANECLDRSLSDDEIEMIEDAITEKVDWFGAIDGTILDKGTSKN
jgi:hypothetical protein